MIDKLKIPVLILILFTLLAVSCEKEVVLDLADIEGKYLIVEADIDDRDTVQWIRLTRSSSYYDLTTVPPVSNAIVTVSGDEDRFVFTESTVDSLKGYYCNHDIAVRLTSGIEYLLRIEHEGEVFSAKSSMRPVPVIDSVSIRLNFFSGIGLTDETLYDILLHFRDLERRGDHYLVNLYLNDELKTVRPAQKSVFSDEDLDEYVSRSVNTINKNDLKKGDLITVELRSISKEMYEFYLIFFFQTDLSGNPFAGAPPANIPTNLSEGARGFFQVSSVSLNSYEFTAM